jgi:hypothetical protein
MSAKPATIEKLKQILQLHKAGQSIKTSETNRRDIETQSDKRLSTTRYNHDTALSKSSPYQILLVILKGLKNNFFHLT